MLHSLFGKIKVQHIRDFFNNQNVILCFWLLLISLVAFKQSFQPTNNNYLIFKYSFFHAKDNLPLYPLYPNEYGDSNHYGPFFSLLIAPFAVLPDFFGMLFWQLANVLFLYFAVKQLPLEKTKVNAIYWIVSHELLTAMFGLQFNISIAAIIILAFVFIERGDNFWAAFVIMLGTFVKLYGIVGLAFFFFAKQKPKFIAYCFLWALVFFILPMPFFSHHYIIDSYYDWYGSLSEKQTLNAGLTSMQDISLMGMVRRLAANPNIPNLPFLIGGLVLFFMPYLRISQYKSLTYRLLYLASTLVFAVIFSNSSESPTYIIAFLGVAIWFMLEDRPIKPIYVLLFVFALLLTSLSPSDLFPKFLKENYIKPYSLKALPCVLIWLVITCELLFKKFQTPAITATNE